MEALEELFPCKEDITIFKMRLEAKRLFDTIPLRGLRSLSQREERVLKYGKTAELFSDEGINIKQDKYNHLKAYLSQN